MDLKLKKVLCKKSKFIFLDLNRNLGIVSKYFTLFLQRNFSIFPFLKFKKEKIKNLKLLFDTGNFNKRSDYKKNFIKYKKFIHHIHISNYNLEELNFDFIKEKIIFFKKNKFRKTLTIEWLNRKNKIREIKKLITFLIQFRN